MANSQGKADQAYPHSVQGATKQSAAQYPQGPKSVEDSPGPAEISTDDVIAILRQVGFRGSPRLVEYLEERLFKWLKDAHVVDADIEALQRAGLRREIIGLALIGISLGAVWEKCEHTFGRKRARQRNEDMLLSSAAFLAMLGKEWGENADASSAESPLSVAGLAKRLEIYANAMKMRDYLREFAEVDSILDIAKYVFVGVVKRITGTYHDREVSALVAAILQNPDYHMEAHRFWRRRMYGRLDQKLSLFAQFFQGANSILSENR